MDAKALEHAVAAFNEASANMRHEWLVGELIQSFTARVTAAHGEVRDANNGRPIRVGDFATEPNAAPLGMAGVVQYVAAPATIVIRNHEGEARHMSAENCESMPPGPAPGSSVNGNAA